jgi:uncharacterized protein YcbK (DUF882 family)
MISSRHAAHGARQFVALAAVIATLSATPPYAEAGNNARPHNPWHRVASFDSDSEHAHLLLETSPFDAMSPLQLAAVPRGKRIYYNAPSKCVPSRLISVLERVAKKYGPITVNSTYRSQSRNRRAGGKKRSYHLKCAAIDFRVHASTKGLLRYLKGQKEVGGYKRYKSGFYHIDIGPRRTW